MFVPWLPLLTLSPWQRWAVPALILAYGWFFFMGAASFRRSADDDGGDLAQISFLASGCVAAFLIGLRVPIALPNAIAAGALLGASLLLYEWARWTVRGRGFHIAWSDHVPDALCDRGPYARVRHPLYTSYILAFLAMLVAMPGWWTLAIFLGNALLFAHAARSDERAIAETDLAGDYAVYRRRAGRFLPRLSRG